MKKISTWLYVGSGVSLFLVYFAWFFYRNIDLAHAESFGIFIGLWVPTLLIIGKIMEDREYRKETQK